MNKEDFIQFRESLIDVKNSLVGWPITTTACLPFGLDNLLWLPVKKDLNGNWYWIKPQYADAVINLAVAGPEDEFPLRMANGLEDSTFSYKVLVSICDGYSIVDDEDFVAHFEAYLT